MKTESIEKELDLCHYLTNLINKLIPMSNAVNSIKTMSNAMPSKNGEEAEIATITLMNGSEIYITGHNIFKGQFYENPVTVNSTAYRIGFAFYNVDGSKSSNDEWKAFSKKDRLTYDFNKENNYKDLDMIDFMKVVTVLVIDDLNKMLNEG